MTRATMGRVVHPRPPYFVNGIVICPDCGTMWWGSVVECRCGVRLAGPRRRPRYLDPTRRTWLIARDGSAVLLGDLRADVDPDPEASA